MHIFTSTEESNINTVIRGRTNLYDEYGRYEPIRDIGTDIVGNLRKVIIYADALHQGS